jgi:hypothetical protein
MKSLLIPQFDLCPFLTQKAVAGRVTCQAAIHGNQSRHTIPRSRWSALDFRPRLHHARWCAYDVQMARNWSSGAIDDAPIQRSGKEAGFRK